MIPHPLSPGPLVWPTLPQNPLPTITLPVVNPSGSPEPSATASAEPSPTATPSEPSPTPSTSEESPTASSSPTPTSEPVSTTCGTTETPCSTVLVEDQFWPLLLGVGLVLLLLAAVLAAQLRRP